MAVMAAATQTVSPPTIKPKMVVIKLMVSHFKTPLTVAALAANLQPSSEVIAQARLFGPQIQHAAL